MAMGRCKSRSTTDFICRFNEWHATLSDNYLKLLRVRIKDPNGNWVTVEPVDRIKLSDTDLAATGVPSKYDKLGQFIEFAPGPNYSQSNGIEFQFQRMGVALTSGNLEAVPGFATQFHRILSIGGALDHAIKNTMTEKVAILSRMKSELRAELRTFYASRDGDAMPNLSISREDYGASAMI
jgi:hypothetical protein